MSAPAYDILLVLHVAAALVGFGAIGAAGLEARAGRRSTDPAGDASVRRFFAPGPDWPARTIFFVPVLGLGLLFGGDHPDISAAWPWIGLAIWSVSIAFATGACWPAERQAQEALGHLVAGADGDERSVWSARFAESCRRMERAVGWISVCFLVAVAVMVLQPR